MLGSCARAAGTVVSHAAPGALRFGEGDMAAKGTAGRSRGAGRVARIKALYFESDFSLDAIAEACGCSRTGIAGIARREGWPPHSELMRERRAAGRAARLGRPCTGLALCPERAEEVRLAFGAVQAQIAALRRGGEGERAEGAAGAERAARVLAQVVRSLKDLAAIDREARGGPKGAAGREEASHDDDRGCPRDADALREELARKLDGLRDEWLARGGRDGAEGPGREGRGR